MIALSQVLWLVRELFARQIDRESDDLRERMLREMCDALAIVRACGTREEQAKQRAKYRRDRDSEHMNSREDGEQ